MNITPFLEQRLDKLNKKYCKQIGHKKVPLIVIRKKDLPNKSLKISVSLSMKNDQECLGIHYPSTGNAADCIFINVERHKNWKQLERTLVHELVHSRWKWQEHNKEFFQRIGIILDGGRFD